MHIYAYIKTNTYVHIYIYNIDKDVAALVYMFGG